MTDTQTYFAARDEFNAATDLVELLRLADSVDEEDAHELDPGAAIRAAMRLAEDLKERAQNRLYAAQENVEVPGSQAFA